MDKINTVSINDALFPKNLLKTKNPPQSIYYSGTLTNDDCCLAIIGSRNCNPKSGEVVDEIVKTLPLQVVIVSGLAKGIDTMAHSSALKYQRKTIAVLPSGINNIYPKENIKLAEQIIKNNGLLISEYPSHSNPTKFSFIQRNRIVASISSAILVIEAGILSGTMTTVNFAKQQGKKIYAIPGTPGCDLLISKGEANLFNGKDICL